jgi:hypothetical protein
LWAGLVTVAIAGVAFILVVALREPERFAFLSRAQVLRTEEWIEWTSTGRGRLKIGGIYRLPGSFADVGAAASRELLAAGWVRDEKRHDALSFRKDQSYATFQPRTPDLEVSLHIQEYRIPTTSDKMRLWMRKFLPPEPPRGPKNP